MSFHSELAKALEDFEKNPIQKFYLDSMSRAAENNERWGQAMFNRLYEINPELAEEIKGTDKDPFYCQFVRDPKLLAFIEFVESKLK